MRRTTKSVCVSVCVLAWLVPAALLAGTPAIPDPIPASGRCVRDMKAGRHRRGNM